MLHRELLLIAVVLAPGVRGGLVVEILNKAFVRKHDP